MRQKALALGAIGIVIPAAIFWVVQIGNGMPAGQQDATGGSGDKVIVVASIFPLYDFARHVGGSKVIVTSLVPAGVEPHDWEPTLAQSLNLRSADLFIYNGAGIDRWADKVDVRLKVNASSGLPLIVDGTGNPDPHTWLDPVLAKKQVELIRDGLIRADPQNADYYNQNARMYIGRLDALDSQIRSSLSNCKKADFIAMHSAFSYFSDRYGLRQHAVLGSPEGDVQPQTLAELVGIARQYEIHVVYSEELLDPRNAESIAASIPSGKVLVLSPAETITEQEQAKGVGYIEKMQSNLENLKVGLECE